MNYITTDTELTSIANAIRSKAGTPDTLLYPSEFISTINSISGGGLSDFNKDVLRAFEDWLIIEHESGSEMYGVPMQTAKTISDIESAIENYGMYRYDGQISSNTFINNGYTPYTLIRVGSNYQWSAFESGVTINNPAVLMYNGKAFIAQTNIGDLPLAYFMLAVIANAPHYE